jgi:hypothetical protein
MTGSVHVTPVAPPQPHAEHVGGGAASIPPLPSNTAVASKPVPQEGAPP